MSSSLTPEEPPDSPPAFSAIIRRNRRRIARACDQCSASRTRCNGDTPCHRCFDLHLRCRYDREVKKRGRRSNASKGIDRSTITVRREPASQSLPLEATYMKRNEANQKPQPYINNSTPNLAPLQPAQVEIQMNAPFQDSHGIVIDNVHASPEVPIPSSSVRPILPVGEETFTSTPTTVYSCRYPCLEPLLPALKGIITPGEACDLLDIYFVEPGNSFFSIHSPYVLSPVLRKSSLLSRVNPRPTSPALLSTMLWCVAHTANTHAFRVPGSRQRIINRLYFLTLSLLRRRDMDNWHRVPGGWRLENDCTVTLANGIDSEVAWTTFSKKQQPTVDDILTFTLLTTVISGGEFKSDSVKWWNKAISLVKFLGYHNESTICDNAPDIPERPLSLEVLEKQEERRRTFWLVYILDRHLSLSFNKPLQILDSECHVLNPLPEQVWRNLDTVPPDMLQPRVYGPLNIISGTGLFEYFLPLMAVLGDIIDLRLRRNHPRLGVVDDSGSFGTIKQILCDLEASLEQFRALADTSTPGRSNAPLVDEDDSTNLLSPGKRDPNTTTATNQFSSFNDSSTEAQTALAIAYAGYIVHVLHVLLHGEWDAVSMLENDGNWITSSNFPECSFQAIAAAQSISDILTIDPELAFMPYLFGIYLFHGSFVLLLFADRMPQVGPNASVEQACEVIIRAHEVCVVTLSTDFQRNFRKALRSTLYSVRYPGSTNVESQNFRKEVLSMYRWTRGGAGLCL